MTADYLEYLSSLADIVTATACMQGECSEKWSQQEQQKTSTILKCRNELNSTNETSNLIEECLQEIEGNNLQCNNLYNLIEAEKITVKQLDDEQQKLQKELEELERLKATLKEKLLEDKCKKSLLKYESLVQACKILTGADFDYSCGPNYSGYISNESTGTVKAFSLNFKEPQQNKKYLWKLMNKMFLSQDD